MSVVSYKDVENKVFSKLYDTFFDVNNSLFVPKLNVFMKHDYRQGSYSTHISLNDYAINIDGENANLYLPNVPEIIPNIPECVKAYLEIRKAYVAYYLHEVAHLRYTQMNAYSMLPIEFSYEQKRFALYFSNILEDISIERFCMGYDYPYTLKYFKYLEDKLFIKKINEFNSKNFSGKKASTLLNYILLRLRCGKAFVPECELYEKHKKVLQPAIVSIVKNPDGAKRFKNVVTLSQWLFKNTDMELDNIPSPQDISGPKDATPTSGKSEETTPSVEDIIKQNDPSFNKEGDSEDDKSKNDNSGEANGDNSQEGENGSSSNKSDKGETASGKSKNRGNTLNNSGVDIDIGELKSKAEEDNVDINEIYNPNVDSQDEDSDSAECFSSIPYKNMSNHRYILAKNLVTPTAKTTKAIDEIINRQNSLVLDTVKSLKALHSRNKPRLERGFVSGKFDALSAMQNDAINGCSLNLFKRKVSNGLQPDLCVSILCDNSGSMYGNKANISTIALITVAKACEYLNIPCEVNLFSENGNNYTINLKEFNDKFSNAKEYFGLQSSTIFGSYQFKYGSLFFSNNVDEQNLYYVYQKLLKVKHKDKILIVMSDGETCGNTKDLRKLSDEISSNGIKVIALGMKSTAVADCYKNYKIFNTTESLSEMPSYLLSILK